MDKKFWKNCIEYKGSDLRFTGWEHECIIINRSENHYIIPRDRYNELKRTERKSKLEKIGNVFKG